MSVEPSFSKVFRLSSTKNWLPIFSSLKKKVIHQMLLEEIWGHLGGLTLHSWSEGFLYKIALPELKISPIMYFVIHNSVVLSKILKIIVPFWPLFVYVDYYQNNQFYRVKIDFFLNFALMAQRFSISWITPLNCGRQNT